MLPNSLRRCFVIGSLVLVTAMLAGCGRAGNESGEGDSNPRPGAGETIAAIPERRNQEHNARLGRLTSRRRGLRCPRGLPEHAPEPASTFGSSR